MLLIIVVANLGQSVLSIVMQLVGFPPPVQLKFSLEIERNLIYHGTKREPVASDPCNEDCDVRT